MRKLPWGRLRRKTRAWMPGHLCPFLKAWAAGCPALLDKAVLTCPVSAALDYMYSHTTGQHTASPGREGVSYFAWEDVARII
jgi:hypothetical protein